MEKTEGPSAAAPVGRGFETVKVATIAASHFVHDIFPAFLATLLPLLIEKLSMSLTMAGLLSTLMQIPALFNPLLGRLADRISVRWFVVLAPSLTAAPMCLIGLAPNYGVLVVLLVVTGVSTALFHVPAPVMVSRLAGGQVGRGMSFFMTGGELARTIGPLFAVAAVALLGLEGIWPLMVIGFAASVLIYWQTKDIEEPTVGKDTPPLGQTWKRMRPLFIPLGGILAMRAFMHASMITFLPTFLKQETGNMWVAGVGLAVLEASGVIGVFTSGTLSDRLGRRRVLFLALMGAPIFLALFVVTEGWLRLPFLVGMGLTLVSTTPVMLALVQEHAGDSPSAANGFFMMLSFIARSIITVPVGLMGDMLGLKAAYLISAGLGLLALPLIRMLPEDRKQPRG